VLEVASGPAHRNPDGAEVKSPHLHVCREGYGDKWATDVPGDRFPQGADPWQTLQDFVKYCNITEPPRTPWVRYREGALHMIHEIEALLDQYRRVGTPHSR